MTDVATLPEPLAEVAPPRGQHGAAAWALWLARRLGLAVLTLWLVLGAGLRRHDRAG